MIFVVSTDHNKTICCRLDGDEVIKSVDSDIVKETIKSSSHKLLESGGIGSAWLIDFNSKDITNIR